jgi:stress responsive alpha/beta barrel protein
MATLAAGRIRHTVVLTPVHEPGSPAEADFLAAAAALASIPGVEAFEILRETSPKNAYRFGISMEFACPEAYAGYNEHPDHVRFVETRWLPEVADFLEIDYEPRPAT